MGWQFCLHNFGSLLQGNSFRLVTILTLCLLILSSALKSYKLETNLSSWIQKTTRIDQELNYLNSINNNLFNIINQNNNNNGANQNPDQTSHQGQGSTSELVLQTPNKIGQNLLTVNSMKAHLEALAIATHVTVDMYDVSWSLKDICFTPTVPIFEFSGLKVDDIMNNLMPCLIKTPLDCFWDGSKLLGPEQTALSLGPFGRNLQWTTLNPKSMIEKLILNYPMDSSYQNLLDWMQSVGISNGYQYRPCLEPSDPKCPATAPNKYHPMLSSSFIDQKQQVSNNIINNNIAAHLTGGCKGFASNLMHWREEEIMGGVRRNKTGYITHADSLQSSILLMGEHDLYEYWKNMRKVLDINDWSISKARNIISSWQDRFTEELQELTRTKAFVLSKNESTINDAANMNQIDESDNQYNIYAMTSKSQLEPIDELSLINGDNFILSFLIMTLFTCLSFPKFEIISDGQEDNIESLKEGDEAKDCSDGRRGKCHSVFVMSKLKTMILALMGSLFVMLTFIASIGLSTFINLPINMATAQILPPLALYYGFNQLSMIANIYAFKFDKLSTSKKSLNRKDTKASVIISDCLNDISPVIMIESVSYIVALAVASLIPIQATRTFAYQGMIFILLMTLSAFTLIPAIIHAFLIKHIASNNKRLSSSLGDHHSANKSKSRVTKTIDPNHQQQLSHEEQLLSRIQEDLKHVRADTNYSAQSPPMYSTSSRSNDINFSAYFDVNGLQTKLRISTNAQPHIQPRITKASRIQDSPSLSSEYQKENPLSRIEKNLSIDQRYVTPPPPLTLTTNTLPDIIASSIYNPFNELKPEIKSSRDELILKIKPSSTCDADIDSIKSKSTATKDTRSDQAIDHSQLKSFKYTLLDSYATGLTECKLVQLLICFLSILILAIVISFFPKVNYGIQLSSILDRNSEKYEPLLNQEKHFPIYNIFIVTKGNFDYPGKQELLHEFYNAFEKIDGIIKEEDSTIKPKFWLSAFRDWLIDLQDKYDQVKNKSLITVEGWAPDVSDTTKLAYKLLAQTGRSDNPIDRNIVDTNRLVNDKGIINVRAFYYYLTAWVMSDSFTYAMTEANLKPELKSWNANYDDLKIEKARAITYAQIPFVIKLPGHHNNLKTISEVRRTCQAYELVLPNFPAGIPFVFWDQFINLDLTFFGSLTMGIMIMFFVTAFMMSDFVIATISVIPMTTTSLELYGFLGYMSIPFNNILAVLVIMSLGISVIQTVHFATFFKYKEGDSKIRTKGALVHRIRVVFTSLTLFLLCALVFLNSKMDFMIGYAFSLLFLSSLNTFNSLLLTPVLLSLFGSNYRSKYNDNECNLIENEGVVFSRKSSQDKARVSVRQTSKMSKTSRRKKRCYVRVQSNISLSTISEESQSRMESPEVKIEISSNR